MYDIVLHRQGCIIGIGIERAKKCTGYERIRVGTVECGQDATGDTNSRENEKEKIKRHQKDMTLFSIISVHEPPD